MKNLRILAVEIGGSGPRAVLVEITREGSILLLGTPTRLLKYTYPEDLLNFIAGLVTGDVVAIVVSCAGNIIDHCVLGISPNAYWLGVDINLANLISEMTGLPVLVGNDMEMAAYGMHQLANEPEGTVAVLTIGSGIGGRIVRYVNGILQLVSERAEFGHAVLQTGPMAAPCGCGGKGHAEALISGDSVRDYIMRTRQWKIWEKDNPNPGHPFEFVKAAYLAEEEWAWLLLWEITQLLGFFLYNLTLGDTDINQFLLKGGLTKSLWEIPGFEEKFLRPVLRQNGWLNNAGIPLRLIPSEEQIAQLGEDADAFIGCGKAALVHHLVTIEQPL